MGWGWSPHVIWFCAGYGEVSFLTRCFFSIISEFTREIKWNESSFRPPLCTYRLNWARRTSWGWWDDWDDTVLQTQDSKFEPWRSEAEHATSRSRRLPAILTFTRGWGRNIFVSFKPPRPGTEPRTLAWKAAVLTTTLGPPPYPGKLNGNESRFWLSATPCIAECNHIHTGDSKSRSRVRAMLGHRPGRWPSFAPARDREVSGCSWQGQKDSWSDSPPWAGRWKEAATLTIDLWSSATITGI